MLGNNLHTTELAPSHVETKLREEERHVRGTGEGGGGVQLQRKDCRLHRDILGLSRNNFLPRRSRSHMNRLLRRSKVNRFVP